MTIEEAVKKVLEELGRARGKYPTWPTDPIHALAVLGEEYGELTRAVLQATYDQKKDDPGFFDQLTVVEEEAIQTAAMALRFLLSLSAYLYEPGDQHSQAEGGDRG